MLDLYQAMVQLSRQMLEAARLAEWPLLVELGQQRDAVEAQLRARQDDPAHAPIDVDQEKALVAVLLAANDQIAQMVDTQLARLAPDPTPPGPDGP